MDVTPRTAPDLDLSPRKASPPRARRWWAFLVVLAVLGGLAFVASKALSDASLFFYNADEAVAKQSELGTDRFRMQGTVEPGTVVDTGDGVDFVVTFNGVEVPVSHRGDPPQLFRPGMPVVLEGRWDPAGQFFSSDRMLVKHDETYEENHRDRITAAEEGGQEPPRSTTTATSAP
ncbi:cytochrome c maturation protein CcmE [Rhabdothermincola sp.]|uniref:cytochrome c maturation protein CcmE n=1 Tax=Rhabdothermincola sp. TaxID=2820405 RepID=UPI002FE4000C